MFKSKHVKQLEADIKKLEERLSWREAKYVCLEKKYDNLVLEALGVLAEKQQKEIEKYFRCGETITHLERGYVLMEIAKETHNFRLTGNAVMQTQYRHNDGRLLDHNFYIASLPALIAENKKVEANNASQKSS